MANERKPPPPPPPAPKPTPSMLGSGAASNAAKKLSPDSVSDRIRKAEDAAMGAYKKGGKVTKSKSKSRGC